ncbi:fibronectin type III domain-containing protein [Streptomyces apocyni]|uniref:fibronectin type III domain-containing protein n=1 Tax=Streptomyces apocyni TaxID=2654677 RepID=UPI001E46C730|nr:fibronectin type III domain-containing protein [Streptomyces apocyni]
MPVRRAPTFASTTAALCLLLTATACSGTGGSDDRQPPTVPRGLTVDAASATSVHVMWNRSTDNVGVTGYAVYRGNTKVTEVAGDRHMVDVARLTPEASYTFSVRARDAAGNVSPASEKVSVTLLAAAADDREPPTKPTRLTARGAGPRAAQLSWRAARDNEAVTAYDVYQAGTRIHSVASDATSTLVTGLRPGTDYTFTVRARDAADNSSPPSGTARLTTAPASGDEPGSTAPDDLRVRARAEDGAYHLDLSWRPPRTGGAIAAYEIHLDGRPTTTLMWGHDAPQGRAEHSFFVTKERGRTYRVKLRARLPDGHWGAFSAERTVTTG